MLNNFEILTKEILIAVKSEITTDFGSYERTNYFLVINKGNAVYIRLCDAEGKTNTNPSIKLYDKTNNKVCYREALLQLMRSENHEPKENIENEKGKLVIKREPIYIIHDVTEQEADDIITASIRVMHSVYKENPFELQTDTERKAYIQIAKLERQLQEQTEEALNLKSLDELETLKEQIEELLLKAE